METKIFDTHAHYDDESFDEDREVLFERLLSTDIESITNIGADIESSLASVRLAEDYENVYAAVGVHPDMIDCLEEKPEEDTALDEIKELAKHRKVVAIGEIGLDYYERGENEKPEEVRRRQKFWFQKQLELANELDLPVVIHSRDAGEDTYHILEKTRVKGGVMHCYSYSAEMAERFVKLGYYIGIGGVITFKNARKTVETVQKIGLDHLVLETDSPYLAPVPFRGKRNDSGNIKHMIEKIAEILGVSEEEVREKTLLNAKRLYGFKEVENGGLS